MNMLRKREHLARTLRGMLQRTLLQELSSFNLKVAKRYPNNSYHQHNSFESTMTLLHHRPNSHGLSSYLTGFSKFIFRVYHQNWQLIINDECHSRQFLYRLSRDKAKNFNMQLHVNRRRNDRHHVIRLQTAE